LFDKIEPALFYVKISKIFLQKGAKYMQLVTLEISDDYYDKFLHLLKVKKHL